MLIRSRWFSVVVTVMRRQKKTTIADLATNKNQYALHINRCRCTKLSFIQHADNPRRKTLLHDKKKKSKKKNELSVGVCAFVFVVWHFYHWSQIMSGISILRVHFRPFRSLFFMSSPIDVAIKQHRFSIHDNILRPFAAMTHCGALKINRILSMRYHVQKIDRPKETKRYKLSISFLIFLSIFIFFHRK